MNSVETSSGASTTFDVFLSHRHTDKASVLKLAMRLQDQGRLRPFLDEWQLVPGLPIQEQLEKGLEASDSCAVLIGPSGLSPWETEEVRVVLEARIKSNKIRVIPVLLPGADEKNIETLPPLLRRFLWVDFRSGLESEEPFARLVAGIQGRPPGRASSSTIEKTSLFVTRSTTSLFQQFIPIDISDLQIDSNQTLGNIAKLLKRRHPSMNIEDIQRCLSEARSKVYDTKYARRETSEDERYVDFRGWQGGLRQLLADIGVRELGRLDVIDVGIGNGNENPDFFSDFKTLTGVDTSRESLDRASRLMPFMKPIHGEAENLEGIATSSYDLYLSLRTYQSSYFDISEATFEAARVLRNRGVAVISVPNVYVDKGKISKGLQKYAGSTLDPHYGWELADRIRRALHQAEFDAWITKGLFEIYIVGER
jgi:SAM-dependent methyltransferase